MPVRVQGAKGAGTSAAWVSSIVNSAAKAIRRPRAELAVVFVGSARMRSLHRYRRRKGATDILSFSAETAFDLGDVFICPAVAKRKAAERGLGYRDYLKLLIVHGVLHLAGYDHETEKERSRMERLEKKILKPLIPNP